MTRSRIVFVATVLALAAGVLPANGSGVAPDNDQFTASTVVYELPFEATADNSAASVDLGEPQPSCRLTKGTVWYAFAPESDVNLIATTSGMFRSTLAVYQGTALSDLAEVACSGGTTASNAEFRALAGNTYFIQLGSSARKRGIVDFKLSPAVWQEKTLHEIDHSVQTNGTDAALFSLHGQPRASNPTIYDITMKVADQPSSSIGLMTFGLVTQKVDLELVKTPARTARIVATVGYRYDASQYQCFMDSGEGTPCLAKSPVKDLNWLTSGDGRRAELVVTIRAMDGDTTVAERTITVPFLGQVAGLP